MKNFGRFSSNSKKFLERINSIYSEYYIRDVNTSERYYQNIMKNNEELISKIKNLNTNDQYLTRNIISQIVYFNKINTENCLSLVEEQSRSMRDYKLNIITKTIENNIEIRKYYRYEFILLSVVLLIAYEYLERNEGSKGKIDYDKILQKFKESSNLMFKTESFLPRFDDHSNTFNQIEKTNKLMLIGDKGIGKSNSIKNYCLIESQKENSFVFYFDLLKTSINPNESIEHFVVQSIERYACENHKLNEKESNELFERLKGKEILFVFDNLTLNTKEVFQRIKKIQGLSARFIIVSNQKELKKLGIENNFLLKNIENQKDEKLIDYCEKIVNPYINNKLEFTNFENLNKENIRKLKEYDMFTFEGLIKYIKSNTSVDKFLAIRKENSEKKVDLMKLKYLNLKLLVTDKELNARRIDNSI